MNKRSLVGFSLYLLLAGIPVSAAEPVTHYIQLQPLKLENVTKESKEKDAKEEAAGTKKAVYKFWRTVSEGGKTKIYDVCEDKEHELVGVAEGSDNSWTLATEKGTESFQLDAATGEVTVNMDGSLYAKGFEIQPIACDLTKKTPTTQPEILNTASVTHYFEITPLPVKAHEGMAAGGNAPNQYWRTVSVRGKTDVYDLCAEKALEHLGTANGAQYNWNMGGQSFLLEPATGKATVTVNGALYARGFDIEPITCDKTKKIPVTPVEFVNSISEFKANSSGAKHLVKSLGKTLMVDRAVAPTQGKEDTTEKVGANTLFCKTAPLTDSAVRKLVDAPALGLNPQFWPGNLIRGKFLPQGEFTPITIGRSGGTLTISGLNFGGDDPRYTIDIDKMTYGKVTEGIKKLLSQPIKSTEGVVSMTTNAAYSSEQVAFELGVDGRFSTAQFAASISGLLKSKKNSVLAKFTQIYYTVSFEDPEFPGFSVFEKGADFEDLGNQIGADNPPLYVKQVGYGRTIYFLASSDESMTSIKAALEGAYNSADGSQHLGVNAEASYNSVMQKTSVSYFVMGGNSKVAVTPISAAPDKMFEAVKKVMTDYKSAQVSALTQGLPISYSISYLTNNRPASLGYATSYDQTNCEIIPPGFYSFSVISTCVDDYVEMSVSIQDDLGDFGKEKSVIQLPLGSPETNVSLDKFMPQKDVDVRLTISEYNVGGPWCNDFKVKSTYRNPATDKMEIKYLQSNNITGPFEYEFKNSGGALVGNRSTYQMLLNRATGFISITKR